jgi:hypothetical protein
MNTPKVELLKTMDLCAALKTALAAINHPTLAGQKLFEVVEYHEDTNLGEALQQLIITKKRVCIIVPQGDRYQTERPGRTIVSTRTTSLDLVIADQAYTRGANDAAFGGANNLGVLRMKEIVLEALAASPQLGGLPWCALYPTEGAMLEISASDEKSAPGRQAWVQNYETPSGQIQMPVKGAWTN